MKTRVVFNCGPTPHYRIDTEHEGQKDSIHLYSENGHLSEEQVIAMAGALENDKNVSSSESTE